MRRAQGLVRKASEELQALGRETGSPIIAEAVRRMREYSRVRVSYFTETLTALKRQRFHIFFDREIHRRPNNPMLRNRLAVTDMEKPINPQDRRIHGYYPSKNTDA